MTPAPTALSAILFGSIGAIAETSDIQRRAYNAALKSHGVDWQWDEDTYRELIEFSGGKDRLRMLSRATGLGLTEDQIISIHAEKTKAACAEVVETSVPLRPGVRALMEHARAKGLKLGLVTTTYAPNIDAILEANDLDRDAFDYIGGREDVGNGKPSPEAYTRALEHLGVPASECVAIEDTAISVQSAARAGIHTVATPGKLSSGQDFWQADVTLDALGADQALNADLAALLG